MEPPAARQPQIDGIIARAMELQNGLELRGCDSVDEAAQPTADALAAICALISDEPDKKRILERLGYFAGRYVYLCDALDDLEKDIAGGGYNPFALSHKIGKTASAEERGIVHARARESLYATIAECARAYALLEPGEFHGVLDNIFSMGMQASVNEILSKKETHK